MARREFARLNQRVGVWGAVAEQGDIARRLGIGRSLPRVGGAAAAGVQRTGKSASVTEEQWEEAERKSRARGEESCAICQEPYGTAESGQVLLHCSHTFHESCLRSYERFAGRSACCPVCRARDSIANRRETRAARDAAEAKAATRIQSLWRGWAVRRWVEDCRATGIRPCDDPRVELRERAEKLGRAADAYLERLDHERAAIEAEIHEIDASAERSAQFCRMAEMSPAEWADVEGIAMERAQETCVICLSDLRSSHTSEELSPREREVCVLAPCSHVYHVTCIESFESFNSGEGPDVCPACRAVYARRTFEIPRSRPPQVTKHSKASSKSRGQARGGNGRPMRK